MRSVGTNRLYFGDCLDVLREDVEDESVDLVYLDPPFNSKRLYNAFIGNAQWVAFEDTWRWSEAVDDFHDVAGRPGPLADTLEGLRKILGEGASLAYLSYMANRLRECYRVLKPTGSLYLHCDPTMNYMLRMVLNAIFGAHRFQNEIIWHYRTSSGKPKKHFIKNTDTIYFLSKTAHSTFNVIREPWPESTLRKWQRDEHGIYRTNNGKKYYVDPNGKRADNVWEITLPSRSAERVGYPTQKPLALLRRIIEASSNPGDLVLDPFCGCGTTVHAAQELGRRWTGIDICVTACQVIEKRLRASNLLRADELQVIGFPVTPEDARTLASMDKFRFERWAASIVDGMEANTRQRGDKGIDGRGRLAINKGRFIDIVSQVKGGSTGPGDVQAFNGARQEAGADLGIFTCFENRVTRRMRDAAASAGRFEKTPVPVIQIFTVEDYFAGRVPRMPRPSEMRFSA